MPMAHLTFLTLFLGLISGRQTVSLDADRVQSIRIEVAGRVVAKLSQPPWTTQIDFGEQLEPTKLEAIGYNAAGTEVARISQVVNLPRPPAEVEIAIKSENERPAVARIIGRHRAHERPTAGQLSIDGKPLELNPDFSASLPRLDWSRPHVLSAEMRFANADVAKRELVMAGGLGDSVASEVTPLLVTTTGSHEPASLAGCFFSAGVELRASALEKPNALVIMVKDPDPQAAISQLRRFQRDAEQVVQGAKTERHRLQLSAGTSVRFLLPIVRQITSAGEATSLGFPQSPDMDASVGGMLWLLTSQLVSPAETTQPRRFADATAVAGVAAMAQPLRRAVVVVLSGTPDRSDHAPAVVRRYLEDIGVPLFVWSTAGVSRPLRDAWGDVDDVSSEPGLRDATAKLDATLAAQRIAWVATDPLAALRLDVKERCGLRMVARHQPVAAPASH